MGMMQPKPYKQFNRATGQWITVIPDPVELNKKGESTKRPFERAVLPVDKDGKAIKNTWDRNR